MISSALLNPAGGLRYHWRALRYSRTLWQAYRWALGEWLLAWRPAEPTLLLVGPSGGYNLQPFFFERFERVVCLEPDPVARYVFTRRLQRAPLDRRPKLELLAEDHLVHAPERLQPLLDRLGPSCVLFSNVIGQLRALLSVDDTEAPALVRVREAVQAAIRGRSWASFHDRVSGTLRPTFEGRVEVESRLTDAEIVRDAYAEATSASDLPQTELLDHLTEGFFDPELPHAYFSWELEPGAYHLIEAVASTRVEVLADHSKLRASISSI